MKDLKEFLIDKFKYDLDCNQKMIDTITKSSNGDIDKLFSHVLNSHHIWISRVNDVSPNFDAWHTHRTDKMTEMADVNFKKIKRIIKNHDLEDQINYMNVDGIKATSTIFEIMFHLINHSQFYRGQAAREMSRANIIVPDTHYITYVGEKV